MDPASAWRPEDSYEHMGVARVDPVEDLTFCRALRIGRDSVELIGKKAQLRTRQWFKTGEHVVQFRVIGCTKLKIGRCAGRATSVVSTVDGLEPSGSHVAVVVAVRAGRGSCSTVWSQCFVDGHSQSDPHHFRDYELMQPIPSSTRLLGGVEVIDATLHSFSFLSPDSNPFLFTLSRHVADSVRQVVDRYMTGAEADQKGCDRFKGLYIRVYLDSQSCILQEVPQQLDSSHLFDEINKAELQQQFMTSCQGRVSVEAVKDLVRRGADINDQMAGNAMTALHWACQETNQELTQFLLNQMNCRTDLHDDEGYTALCVAVLKCDLEIVEMFIACQQHSDPMRDGTTPLTLAEESGNHEVAAALEQAGAEYGGPAPIVGCDYSRVTRLGQHELWETVRSPLTSVQHTASQYPAQAGDHYLDMLQRMSDCHYAMYTMCTVGTMPCYAMAKRRAFWERHYIVPGVESGHMLGGAFPEKIIDTVHMDLQNPTNGQSLVTADMLHNRAGPEVEALFLHCCSEVTEDDLIQLVSKCPNLRCLAISQCSISDHFLSAVKCPHLQCLRLSMVYGQLGDAGLTELLQTCTELQWLDIGAPGSNCSFSTSWKSLQHCQQLRVLALPGSVTAADVASLSHLQGLEILFVEKASLPIETLTALAALPLRDIDGFVLGDSPLSIAVAPLVNRLCIQALPVLVKPVAASFTAVRELVLRLDNGLCGLQMAALVESTLPKTLQSFQLGACSTHPSVISQCSMFSELRVLDLSSCFRNEYEVDECASDRVEDFDDQDDMEYWSQMEPLEANAEALHNVCYSLKNLVQLDISAHYDCFYSCLEPNGLVDAIQRCFKLQRLNLNENGRKYPWGQVKRQADEFFEMLVKDGLPECVVVWPEGMADNCHHSRHASYGSDSEDY